MWFQEVWINEKPYKVSLLHFAQFNVRNNVNPDIFQYKRQQNLFEKILIKLYE